MLQLYYDNGQSLNSAFCTVSWRRKIFGDFPMFNGWYDEQRQRNYINAFGCGKHRPYVVNYGRAFDGCRRSVSFGHGRCRRKNHRDHGIPLPFKKRSEHETETCLRSLPKNQFLANRRGFAKIMRPAAVCSADVTSTSIFWFRWRWPPSMTIIVPSSR